MKIEELERLAVAATAALMGPIPTSMTRRETVERYRHLYELVLAEFIEQEKSEKGGAA